MARTRNAVLLGAWLAIGATANSLEAKERLPFNNGLYAADHRFCLLTLEQGYDVYGGWTGQWTRSLSDGLYSNNFELDCEIQKISRSDHNITAVAECSGEGDDSRVDLKFRFISQDSFVIGGKRFDRCGSDATIDRQVPSTSELIKLAVKANSDCRGLPEPESSIACGKRDLLDGFLYQRGMCSTEPDWPASQEVWHVCHDLLRKSE